MSQTEKTARQRVDEYAVTLFRSTNPHMNGTSNFGPTRAVTTKHARIIAEEHAADAVDAIMRDVEGVLGSCVRRLSTHKRGGGQISQDDIDRIVVLLERISLNATHRTINTRGVDETE